MYYFLNHLKFIILKYLKKNWAKKSIFRLVEHPFPVRKFKGEYPSAAKGLQTQPLCVNPMRKNNFLCHISPVVLIIFTNCFFI